MHADAHIHLADLAEREPLFPEALAASLGPVWTCCAASHDEPEWRRSEELRSRLPPTFASFGIHPQWAVWKNADFLARLCGEGKLAAIGEAGFDFYGDKPERVRNSANEAAQRGVFEYQLELAERHGLPLLLHLRSAMDLAFAYAPRLRRLPAAIFHSYPGSAAEGAALLARGVEAFFSFGSPVLNGNKRAARSCAALPADRILAETDAPWQPPRGEGPPPPGGRYCRAEDIVKVAAGIASLRGIAYEAALEITSTNFARAYGRAGRRAC